MIRIPGQPGRDLCDPNLGVTRRDVLRVGGSALLVHGCDIVASRHEDFPST